MKIAYVYDAIYPYVKGGVEKRIYEISNRLVERGHEVHWFGLKWWNGEEKNTVLNGINLHGVGKWSDLYDEGRRSIGEGVYFGFKTLLGLKGDFDVVDCQSFPYFSCFSVKAHSLLKKFKFVITWHEVWGDYWFEYLGKKGIFGLLIEKMASLLAEKNVAVSKRTKENLEEIGVKNIIFIPNGIEFKEIEEVKPKSKKSDVIFAGRLIKEKNLDILLSSLKLIKKEIPDIRCVIIGDGPEKEYLERIATKLRIKNNVDFMGFLDNYKEVIAYMKASKVFVLPSTREGFGIVTLEANACGLPVVTVNHKRNAACDFITNENGFICKLSDEDIAKKILTGLNVGSNMKKKCIEKAIVYDWNRIVDFTELFYRDL